MGVAEEARPVKLILGMLAENESWFEIAERYLTSRFGPVDDRSPTLLFDSTDYYQEELGPHILRRFLAFQRLIRPDSLPEIKLYTNSLEAELMAEGKRRVNLDPGYIAPGKLVLATTKDWQHRLYLGRGIYGEVTLRFRKGSFEPWEWTYPDYRREDYIRAFNRFRRHYMAQLREEGQAIER